MNRSIVCCACCLGLLVLITAAPLSAAPAYAGPSIDVSKDVVTKNDTLKATLNAALTTKRDLTGDGQCKLTWTDCWGRTVAVETQNVHVTNGGAPISMPLAQRSVGMDNFIEAELTVGDTTVKFPKTEFIVTPDRPWDDYAIVMYSAYHTPEQQWALRDVGVTDGQIQSGATQDPNGGKKWWSYDYQFYCDQISTYFYAAYHTPAQNPEQKALLEAKAVYKKDTTKKDAFFRYPSLSDEKALAGATGRVAKAVEAQMRYKPLFYACTDEGGVADLVTAWDFDFSPPALAAMRQWLMQEYGSLDAINKEWNTKFATLEDVTPLSTDEMMARGDDNLSPWADHRFFMNKAFADAVHAGVEAGHAVDKNSLVGLVGCQMPSAFGGYDYWRLSQALDCIEPYNIGNSREVWRSFAPHKPAMTTAFGFGDFEVWRLWYQALQGDQGIIIYEETKNYLDPSAQPTKMATQIQPTYSELTGGIAKQMHYMSWDRGPVLIHYSQPSITAHWMIEARPEGKAWTARGSAAERRQSEFLRLRESWTKLLEDNLQQSDFVSYAQLEDGDLGKMDAKVLVLPQSIAMSEKECDAVRDFVARGGVVIADCRAALMDGHCKMLEKGQLDDLFGITRADMKFAPGPAGLKPVEAAGHDWPDLMAAGEMDKVSAAEPGVKPAAGSVALFQDSNGTPAVIVHKQGKGMTVYLNAVVTDYHRWRLRPPEGASLEKLVGAILKDADAQPRYEVTVAGQRAHGIELFPYSSGDLKLLALNRNYQIRISELGPTEYQSQGELQKPMSATVDLGKEYAVYDSRAGKYLGKQKSITVDLKEWEPTILAFLPEPVTGLTITAPEQASGGDLVDVKMSLAGPNVGDMHAFHVTVTSPDGKEIKPLCQNVIAPKGQASIQIPIAMSDPKGQYNVSVRDAATGTKAEQKITVK